MGQHKTVKRDMEQAGRFSSLLHPPAVSFFLRPPSPPSSFPHVKREQQYTCILLHLCASGGPICDSCFQYMSSSRQGKQGRTRQEMGLVLLPRDIAARRQMLYGRILTVGHGAQSTRREFDGNGFGAADGVCKGL